MDSIYMLKWWCYVKYINNKSAYHFMIKFEASDGYIVDIGDGHSPYRYAKHNQRIRLRNPHHFKRIFQSIRDEVECDRGT